MGTGQLLAQSTLIDSLRTRLKTEGKTTERVDLLQALGDNLLEVGKADEGHRLTEEARGLATQLNYPKGLARALEFDAERIRTERRYPEALAAYKESIDRLDGLMVPLCKIVTP